MANLKINETAIVNSVACAPLKKRVAFHVGEILVSIFKSRATRVESGGQVGSAKLLDRVIRNGLRAQAIRTSNFRRLRDLHRTYWKSQAHKFASDCQFRFEEQFLAEDSTFLDNAEKYLACFCIDRIVEVGCGNGLMLQYRSKRWPSVSQCVGIDIDPSVIENNARTYSDDNMQFPATNPTDWMTHVPNRPALLITNGGVLEYFLREEVESLFTKLRKHAPCAILLIETLGSDHDLENDCETRLYGRELSFSHNFPNLLRKCGFEVASVRERVGKHGDRWFNVLGIAGQDVRS